ncbi:MAG: hypothetical protein WBM17_13570 [Anaerolineales bacterium]
MGETAIQRLVCQAVISDQYRNRLLGSERAEVLRTSGLDEQEQEVLLSIPAGTLEEFAAGVERMARQWKRAGMRSMATESAAPRGLIEVELPHHRA